MKRYIIAIDYDGGIYVRETLVVTHDGESGNAIYNTRPLKRIPKKLIDVVNFLKQKFSAQKPE